MKFPFAAAHKHFAARLSHNAGLIQAPGVLVKAGSLKVEQQIYVKNAVWDPSTKRGSGSILATHIVPGGLYVVHSRGQRRFKDLLEDGYTQNKNGDLSVPMCDTALSQRGRDLISAQLTTITLPSVVDRLDLATEGTQEKS